LQKLDKKEVNLKETFTDEQIRKWFRLKPDFNPSLPIELALKFLAGRRDDVISGQVSREYASGPGPSSFAAKLAFLGDPNVGVISPRGFYASHVISDELCMFGA